jgi:hypothetical protein
VIGQASGEEAAAQGDYRESPDDESDSAVGTTEVVPHMRSESRQDGAEAQKSEEGSGDQAPKASRQ